MAMPMFHVATAPCTHWSPLNNGVQTFVMRRFELDPWLEAIETHQITDLASVPPVIVSVIMSNITKKYSITSVKFATCGRSATRERPSGSFSGTPGQRCSIHAGLGNDGNCLHSVSHG